MRHKSYPIKEQCWTTFHWRQWDRLSPHQRLAYEQHVEDRDNAIMMAHIRGTKQSRRVAARMLPVLVAGFVLVHSWYEKQCCADRDCRPVPCDEISRIADGWVYHHVEFRRFQMKPSLDDHCHVCITDTGMTPLGQCIYLPLGT